MPVNNRVLAWFSCGDASAVAAKLAVDKYGDRCEVLYCDTFAYEHPDNLRFFADVERWLGRSIIILRSREYKDIYDVFRKTRWLVGPSGCRCTTELKKVPRMEYQRPDDTHVFGFTMEEQGRVDRFYQQNPELIVEFPLIEAGYTKNHCHHIVRDAGIELPAMYRWFDNNNCIGCPKGGKKYWSKIRRLFPEHFAKMAAMERELDVAICKSEGPGRERIRVFLDELPPDVGQYPEEAPIECGVLCIPPIQESLF